MHAVECDAGETKALAGQIEVDETIKQIKAFQVLGDKQQACQHHRLTRVSICLRVLLGLVSFAIENNQLSREAQAQALLALISNVLPWYVCSVKGMA